MGQQPQNNASRGPVWLDVIRLARVECSSEHPAHPVRSALAPEAASGWRAAQPGEQTIRLVFREPLHLQRARLVFEETQRERRQEFVLSWSADGGRSYREIVRQQYNFSPPSTTREVEDYTVDLAGVTDLELTIVPDVSGSDVCASMARLQLA